MSSTALSSEPESSAAVSPQAALSKTTGAIEAQANATSISAESALLGSALSALNQQQDPRTALQVLDQYRNRFPRGALVKEAQVTRVQAFLALHDEGAALGLLASGAVDGFSGYPRPYELRLLRAELLGRTGHCREALGSFSQLLLEEPEASLRERALAGRAGCEAQANDESGSRKDWKRYLELFPNGPSVDAARQAIGE